MRSKTAEFERMLGHQQGKPIAKSQSSQFHSQSASGARSNDSKSSTTKTIKTSKCFEERFCSINSTPVSFANTDILICSLLQLNQIQRLHVMVQSISDAMSFPVHRQRKNDEN